LQISGNSLKNGIPVTDVVYPDEGHGFVPSENRISFYVIIEHFLARHRSGVYETAEVMTWTIQVCMLRLVESIYREYQNN